MYVLTYIRSLLGLDDSDSRVPGIALWDQILDISGVDSAEIRQATRILEGRIRYVWGGPITVNPAGNWVKDERTLETGSIYELLPISDSNSERRGGDCSGVTQTVLRYAGLLPSGLGRLTADSMHKRFAPVDIENAIPGDCVFYGAPGAITHVVYIVGRDSDNVPLVASMNGGSKNYGEDPKKTMYVYKYDYRSDFVSIGRPK